MKIDEENIKELLKAQTDIVLFGSAIIHEENGKLKHIGNLQDKEYEHILNKQKQAMPYY